MKKICLFWAVSVLAALLVFACTTPPEPAPAPEPPPAAEPAPEPEPVPVPDPEPVPDPLIEAEDPSIKITQEHYEQTFSEVEGVINELNATIKAKNMRKWESYLTPQFRNSIMAPRNLAEINDMPLLKRNNIKITTLKDYFDYVVVPSRANVRLDDLKFTDENRVKAFMKVSTEENVLIYQLEKIGRSWKISVW